MLPVEIYLLVLLASTAVAIPQPQQSEANSTGTASHDTFTKVTGGTFTKTNVPDWAHQESSATGFDDHPTSSGPLATSSITYKVPIVESSQTGWETTSEPPRTTSPTENGRPTPPHDIIITTDQPIIITVHTEISASGFQPDLSDPASGKEHSSKPSGPNGSPSALSGSPEREHTTTGPSAAEPQVTPGGSDLLNEIISRVGNAQPGAQPTGQPAVPTDGSPAPNGNIVPSGNLGTAPANDNTQQGSQSSLAVGAPITLGSATLTLTPGLSTTVGTGSDATAVAINTNASGSTIIIISSSGTAITAIVTKAKTTITSSASRTGFDASISEEARPGNDKITTLNGAATSTRSAGGAASRFRWEVESWIGILAGIGALL